MGNNGTDDVESVPIAKRNNPEARWFRLRPPYRQLCVANRVGEDLFLFGRYRHDELDCVLIDLRRGD